jgi:hypothetical protein
MTLALTPSSGVISESTATDAGAHHSILFPHEPPELRRHTLEVLCQPTLPTDMRAAVHRLTIHSGLVKVRLIVYRLSGCQASAEL